MSSEGKKQNKSSLEIMKEKKTLSEKELTTKTKQISTLQESSKQMKAKLEEQRRSSLHELSRKDDKIANLTQCIEMQAFEVKFTKKLSKWRLAFVRKTDENTKEKQVKVCNAQLTEMEFENEQLKDEIEQLLWKSPIETFAGG